MLLLRREIERNTRGQAESEQWFVERRKRLTASHVGSIAKMRKNTQRSNKVQNLLYSKFRGNEATQYGVVTEDRAIQYYITNQLGSVHQGLSVVKCGLFVLLDNPWLAASPDGIIYDPQISGSYFGTH